jgi:hypothetical protein
MTLGAITRVSTTADGTQPNRSAYSGTIAFSPDGTSVLFGSFASNLVTGDTNNTWDLFLKNLVTGVVTRVSTTSAGGQANGGSGEAGASFSPDGTSILFVSRASDLVPGDTNGDPDYFIKNLVTGAVTRVSTAANGAQVDGDTGITDLSSVFAPGGGSVLFTSGASNLVPGDTNGKTDLFLKNLATGAVTRVSTASNGSQANGASFGPFAFSPDGTRLLFYSEASNLVAGDTNGVADLFLKNLVTGAVTRVNTAANGAQANNFVAGAGSVSFSPDGNNVLFSSAASNLIASDFNGHADVFLKNLATGAIARVSGNVSNNQPNGGSVAPYAVFTADGGSIIFNSDASNIMTGDTNLASDIYMKNLATGVVTRLSTTESDGQANGPSFGPLVLTPDGNGILFTSDANNLIAGDTNSMRDIFIKTFRSPATTTTTLNIAATDASRAEGHAGTSAFTFLATRSGDTSSSHTAAFAVAGTGANPAAASDFAGGVLPSGTVSFAPGETSRTVTVTVAGDTTIEPDETFTLTLSNPSAGATLGTASAGGTIINDDAQLSVAALAATKAEGQSGTTALTFLVTRSGDTSTSHTAAFAVAGSGANPAAASDFAGGVLPSGTVSFAPGEASRTVTIIVAGDTAVEEDETFTLTLSNPSAGATLGTASAGGTITNDDAQLSVSAVGASKAEGQSGTTALTFLVTRSGDTSAAHTAAFAVAGSGANPADASDFAGGVLPSGTVSFAPGEINHTVTIDVAGDMAVEADETFTLTLSNPSAGATLGTASASGTIINDDAQLSVAALAATKAEGQSGTTALTFLVTRSGDTSAAHTAAFTVAGSGANPAAASDFAGGVLPSGTVSFAPGEASRTVTVAVAGDTTIEPDETFTLTLSNPSAGATLGTASASGTIINDDAQLSVAALAATKAEGQSGTTALTFLVTRSGDTSAAHTAAFTVAGSGANPAAASDFASGVLPSGTVSFAPGETSHVVTIDVAGNTAVEADETFTLTLSSPSANATLGTASASGTIINDDAQLSVAALAATKAEGQSGTTALTFLVTRSGDSSTSHTAAFAVAGSGANPAAASDFAGGVLPSGTVSFAPGETSHTVTIDVAGDLAVEADETFTLTLSAPSAGAILGTVSATGTIQTDDFAPNGTLSIARLQASRAEGQTGTTPFTFRVTRTGNIAGQASVKWAATAGGVASTGGASASDFALGALPSGVVTFAAGETAKTISVGVMGDAIAELNESFTVTLSGTSAGVELATASATGLIWNDDTPGTGALSIARASAQKPEGNTGSTAFTFTVSRGGDASGTASADWAVTGGGVGSTVAANGADFVGGVLPSGRVNFAAGQAQATVTVLTAGDSVIELNDSFTVTLSAPQSGVAIATATATGVILNDDFPPSGVLSIAGLQAERGEGAGGSTGFTFVVTRAGTITGPASAAWAVEAGNATADDFAGGTLPTGTVTFAPGQASEVITIPVAGDSVVELDETFTVTLSGVPAGVSLGVASAEGVIRNDDPGGTGTLSIARASAQKPEGHAGATPFTFTVTRGGDASGMAAADWAVSGGGASGTTPATGADFAGGQLPSGRVTFAPGELQQTISVGVAGDIAVELNESFAVTLSNTPAGVAIGTAAAIGIILNDDLASTAANQTLNGSDAPDVFLLGGGLDSVFGRAGLDGFRFLPAAIGPASANATTLQDFSRVAGEVIDLSAIDAIAGTLANDAFSFVGTAAFSAAGQLRWQDQGSLRLIQGEVTGDGVADVTILVAAPGPVDSTWFIL